MIRKIIIVVLTLGAAGVLVCGLIGIVRPLNPTWKVSNVSFVRVTFAGGYVQLACSFPVGGAADLQAMGQAELDLDIRLRAMGGRARGAGAFKALNGLTPRRTELRLPGLVAWTATASSLATFDWSNAKTIVMEPTGIASGRVVRFGAVVLPFWIPPALPAAWLVTAFIRGPLRRYRRRKRGLCVTCGYDLRGSPGRCPACGAGIKMP